MIRTIMVTLDGVLVPRLSLCLWRTLKEQAPDRASRAINTIYPLFEQWKRGTLLDDDLWNPAAQSCGIPAEKLQKAFLARVIPDTELAAYLTQLSAAYTIIVRPDAPASLWNGLQNRITSLYPPPIRIDQQSAGIECSRQNDEELYLVADSCCAYALSGARARVILYTNLFRLRRELALRGLTSDK